MIVFRHADPRYPFLWDTAAQPEGRWHGAGEGPANYFADTPHGAWAELLRHEGITTKEELATIRRALWAVEIDAPSDRHALSDAVARGDASTYDACRAEARRLRAAGASGLVAKSAALGDGQARGAVVRRGKLNKAKRRDGLVYVLFGARPDIIGWSVVLRGRPANSVLRRVRHF